MNFLTAIKSKTSKMLRMLKNRNYGHGTIETVGSTINIIDLNGEDHKFRTEDIIEISAQKIDRFSFDDIFLSIVYLNQKNQRREVQIEESAPKYLELIAALYEVKGFDKIKFDKILSKRPAGFYESIFRRI